LNKSNFADSGGRCDRQQADEFRDFLPKGFISLAFQVRDANQLQIFPDLAVRVSLVLKLRS
jgi:hypothetical protein